MKNENDAILDDLLARWHGWQKGTKLTRGFSPKSVVCAQFTNVQVQYDAQIEQTDVDLDNARSHQVDYEVRQLADPHRSALYCLARNLSTGLSVWDSPRLPRGKEEREEVVAEARGKLTKRLISSGVM